MQPAPVTQRDVFADDAVRPDLAFSADLRFGMDDCRRMNHGNFKYWLALTAPGREDAKRSTRSRTRTANAFALFLSCSAFITRRQTLVRSI
jgi:hypothetical protein